MRPTRQRTSQRRAEEARWRQEREEARVATREARRGWQFGAAALAVTIVGLIMTVVGGERDASAPPQAERQPSLKAAKPAADETPPVLIESVTPMASASADGTFALSEPLRLKAAELDDFNRNTAFDQAALEAWSRKHRAAAVDHGLTTFTLRGNAKQSVRIADLRVIKRCGAPLSGTMFSGYSQGSGETSKVGFDLDSALAQAQTLAMTGARGTFALGNSYFAEKTVQLQPGEEHTVTVGVLTKRQSCEFTLRLFVTTPEGVVYEDIDDAGQPFRVTAQLESEGGASKYRETYRLGPADAGALEWASAPAPEGSGA